MAINVRGYASTSGNFATSGTMTVLRSSLTTASVAGDLLLAFVNYNNQDNYNAAEFNVTTPTGWTIGLTPTLSAGGNDWIAVYKRTATGDANDNFVLNYSGDPVGNSNDATTIVVTIQDAGTPTFTTPVYVGGSTTMNIPSIGSTGNLLLVNAGNFIGPVSYGSAPSGMTLVTSKISTGANKESSVLYQQVLGTAGTRTVTTTAIMYASGVGVAVPYVPAGTTWTASASLSVAPSVSATAVPTYPATSAVTVTPSVSATATVTKPASASVTVTPTVTATGGSVSSGSILWSAPPTWSSFIDWSGTWSGEANLTVTPSVNASGIMAWPSTANVTVTPSTSATAQVVKPASAAVTVTPSVTATPQLTVSATANLTVTPATSAQAFIGKVAQAYLTVTPTTTAQGTTPGTISPVTISGTTITPTTPTTIAYWASWSTWGEPSTYGQNVGSATITPIGV